MARAKTGLERALDALDALNPVEAAAVAVILRSRLAVAKATDLAKKPVGRPPKSAAAAKAARPSVPLSRRGRPARAAAPEAVADVAEVPEG